MSKITPKITKQLLVSIIISCFQRNSTTDFVINLPRQIDNVTKMKIVSSEIPITCYNFSESKNNKFKITLFKNNQNHIEQIITIPDGRWYSDDLLHL